MRILRRVLVGALVLVVGLLSAVAVSIPIDRWLSRGAVEAVANVALRGPDGPLHAYVARPATGEGPFPLVVMIHEFWGLDAATTGKADLLAQDGYVVVAPDLMRGRTTRWLPSAIWQTLRTPDERVRAHLDATVAAFATDAAVDVERLAVMGFCFGGRMSLRYALERPAVVATGVFYGNVEGDPDALRRLGGPVLGVFGADDGSIPLAEVAAFERGLAAAGVAHEVRVFDGVGHAFVTTAEAIAADPVQGEAWALLRAFLRRTVGG
ncbi:MAG: dienelactone hydrolase family protein [bacterium]|nr:dienelactone hydrolase family protein [bacterium]